MEISVYSSGEVVLQPARVPKGKRRVRKDRFDAVRVKADNK